MTSLYNRLLQNPVNSTLSTMVAAKGLQIANQSFSFVKNSSMIVNPSQIAGPMFLASLADKITRKALDKILGRKDVAVVRNNYTRVSDANAYRIKHLVSSAVKLSVLMGISPSALPLIEAVALVYFSQHASHLVNIASVKASELSVPFAPMLKSLVYNFSQD